MAWWGRSVRKVGSGWSESGGSEYAASELEEMVRREVTAAAQPSFYADPGMWNYAWHRRRPTKSNCTALCNPWTCLLHPVAVSEECPVCYTTDLRPLPCHVCTQSVCAACRIRLLNPDARPSCPFCRSHLQPDDLQSLAETAHRHTEFQLDERVHHLLNRLHRVQEYQGGVSVQPPPYVWPVWDEEIYDTYYSESAISIDSNGVERIRRPVPVPEVVPTPISIHRTFGQEDFRPAETSASQDTCSTASYGGWCSFREMVSTASVLQCD